MENNQKEQSTSRVVLKHDPTYYIGYRCAISAKEMRKMMLLRGRDLPEEYSPPDWTVGFLICRVNPEKNMFMVREAKTDGANYYVPLQDVRPYIEEVSYKYVD